MRGQNQSDTFVLKHRLTGAAVLIGFAVVVLPMLLGGPEEQTGAEPAEQGSSEPESGVFRSNITPIGGDTPSVQAAGEPDDGTGNGSEESAGSVASEDVATNSDSEGGQGSGQANGQSDGQGSAEAQGGASGGTEAAGGDDGSEGSPDSEAAQPVEQTLDRGWIVQVGTFKNSDNVAKLVAQLEEDGFSTSTSEVDTSEGLATRVWVGPYETRVEAARQKTRVKQRTGTEGLIVAYP